VFHYDLAGHLIAESMPGGEVLREYVYLYDLPVAMISNDHDDDGVPDARDNCILDANADQRDTSGSGVGNVCNGDADGDGALTQADLTLLILMVHRGLSNPAAAKRADLNGDGVLNFQDETLLAQRIRERGVLGPSGLRGQSPGPELFFIHADQSGTPRLLTDASQRVRWRWDAVDPFGMQLPSEIAPGDVIALPFNLRFPGQYYDRETGLHYNYFRDYDPGTGRYIESDPIGLRGGLNTYAYVNANPLLYIDPLGLDVGAPGLAESFIPVWGSGREAINDFQTGHYVWGTVNGVIAASDAVLIGYGVKALCKGAWKMGSHTWSATRKWYGKTRELPPNTQVHHWAVPQGGWGKTVPDVVKNQPWNLNPMRDWATHANIHGYGPDPYNAVGRWWHGTPDWAKIAEGLIAGKSANAARDVDCECDQ
jgi:RHS repeat-associated protein